jgi:hypothetical protein
MKEPKSYIRQDETRVDDEGQLGIDQLGIDTARNGSRDKSHWSLSVRDRYSRLMFMKQFIIMNR